MKNIKYIIGLVMLLLFSMSSVYSAEWYDMGCWFNDNPQVGATITVYDENGIFKSIITEDSLNHIDNLVITEGEQLKIDFGITTDDENNIQQERIFWNHDTRNDWTMNIQDSVSTLTTIGTSTPSSTKFDFYDYLSGGLQSKPQFFDEHNYNIDYNNGNSQFHFVKTFMPEVGNYELLLRVTDSCSDGDGTDESYSFIPIEVKSKTVEIIYEITDKFDDFNRGDSSSLGLSTMGSTWTNDGKGMFGINTQNAILNSNGAGNSLVALTYPNTNDKDYFGYDIKMEQNTPTNILFNMWYSGGGSTGFTSISNGQVHIHTFNYDISDGEWHRFEIKNVNVGANSLQIWFDGTYRHTLYGSISSILHQSTKIEMVSTSSSNEGIIYRLDNLELKKEVEPVILSNICDLTTPIITITYPPTSYDIIIEDGCEKIISQTSVSFNVYDERTNTSQWLDFDTYGIFNFIYDTPIWINEVTGGGKSSTWMFNKESIENRLNSTSADNIYNMNGIIENFNDDTKFAGVNNVVIESSLIKPNIRIFNDDLYNSFIYLSNGIDIKYEGSGTSCNFYNNYIKYDGSSKLQLTVFQESWDNNEFTNNYFDGIMSIDFQDGFVMSPKILDIYSNVFKMDSTSINSIISFSTNNITLGKEINGKMLGNVWLDMNGNDLFICSGSIIDIYHNNIYNKVCDIPILIKSYNGQEVFDYIIITDSNLGGIIPVNPIDPTVPPIDPTDNKKPVAILDIDTSNEVEVGTIVCWNTADSYDSDGGIVSKTVWVGDEVFNNLDSDCFTKNTPQVIDIKLEVTDDEGLKDDDIMFVKFSNTEAICSGNTPTDIVISSTLDSGSFYYLNMTVTDLDGDTDFTYAWTVNGETIYGKDILTTVNYNQNVYGSVFDGCNITSDYIYIDVGQNFTDPIENIDVNLICSQSSLFTPSNINCEVVKDLKGENLDTIKWTYDNSIQTQNDGASIFSRSVGDSSEHMITVTVITLEGQIETDYYRFNLIEAPITDGGGSGGGDTTTKEVCDIDFTPSLLEITEAEQIVKLTFTNNELGSWSPDYSFNDIEDEDSVRDELSITNEIGTIQAESNFELGIIYNPDLFATENVDAKNTITFTSSNCEDIVIDINTIINNNENILAFADNELLSFLNPEELLMMTVIEKENIPDEDSILNDIQVWQIIILMGILFTFIFWEVQHSKSLVGHYIIKTTIISLLTIFSTIVLVYLIRYIIGVI